MHGSQIVLFLAVYASIFVYFTLTEILKQNRVFAFFLAGVPIVIGLIAFFELRRRELKNDMRPGSLWK